MITSEFFNLSTSILFNYDTINILDKDKVIWYLDKDGMLLGICMRTHPYTYISLSRSKVLVRL